MNKTLSTIWAAISNIPAQYRTNVPKWIRFILFYTSALIWGPILVLLAIPMSFIAATGEFIYAAYRTFDD